MRPGEGSHARVIDFPVGDGEMVERVRAHDWAATPLGPIEAWPQSLKTAVGLMLAARHPAFVAWGPERIWLNNDAFIPILGDKNLRALGLPTPVVWREVDFEMRPISERVFAGESVLMTDIRLMLDRHGRLEETHFAFSYTPVRDESGAVAGLFGECIEMTEQLKTMAELRAAGEALRDSEERTRLAAEAAGVGFWDHDCVTDRLNWSPRVKAMYGISPDQPVTPEDRVACLHPDDRAASVEAFAAACDAKGRGIYHAEYRTIGKEDHVQRWVSSHGRAVFDEHGRCLRVIGAAIDITARKATEKQLRELNEALERRVAETTAERDRVWRHSRDLFVVTTRVGVLRSVNPAWTQILGYEPTEVVGRNIVDFIFPEDAVRTIDAQIEQGGLVNFENRYVCKDGSLKWISWQSFSEGKLIYGYGRDVTEAKKQQEALAETEAALRQAQKMEAMGQLTGGIAHDFNNLLQGVAGNLDLIRRRPENTEGVRRWAEAGFQAAQRGTALTAQLLAFSRAQKLELKSLDLPALLSGMREMIGRTLGHAIRVRMDLDPRATHAMGDQTQLELAVLNLAINARDAMPEGGAFVIRTRARHIEHDPDVAPGDFIELDISDTGAGMAPETLARAFDPFFTTKGIGKGTGLGLSQVYGMARQAGGIARIESFAGKGTSVRILLPRGVPTEAQAVRSAEPETDASAASVLIVDDDPDVRRFLAETLDCLGYAVEEAQSGPAGLAALARSHPDVMVVDFAMPGMTGAEVAMKVRARHERLPILFVSGYVETAALETLLDHDMAVLRKPFQVSDLQNAIEGLLQRR